METLIKDPLWKQWLAPFLKSREMKIILSTLMERKKAFNTTILPSSKIAFKAFEYPADNIKVVILGQDPYHTKGKATGLAFANHNDDLNVSPSLRNIILEIEQEYDTLLLTYDTSLEKLAEQGVFLFNTALTVEEGRPESHLLLWKPFTKEVLRLVEENNKPIYLLFGKKAEKAVKFLNIEEKRKVITPHPSPLSAYRGFIGSGCFKKVNKLLKEQNKKEIAWY